LSQPGWIARGHEASVLIAQYLRNAAYICGDDRPSARERLNHHIGVTLHVTRRVTKLDAAIQTATSSKAQPGRAWI